MSIFIFQNQTNVIHALKSWNLWKKITRGLELNKNTACLIMIIIHLAGQRKATLDLKVCQFDYRGSLNKFPDIFRIGTFIDSTLIKL